MHNITSACEVSSHQITINSHHKRALCKIIFAFMCKSALRIWCENLPGSLSTPLPHHSLTPTALLRAILYVFLLMMFKTFLIVLLIEIVFDVYLNFTNELQTIIIVLFKCKYIYTYIENIVVTSLHLTLIAFN